VWNKRTGNIVGGHQRYRLLVDEGVSEATMIVVDFDADEEIAANLTLNNPQIEGDWDDPINDLLSQVQRTDPSFFADANFEELRKAVDKMVPNNDSDQTDTECPCCGHRWNVSDGDVVVMSEEEQETFGREECDSEKF